MIYEAASLSQPVWDQLDPETATDYDRTGFAASVKISRLAQAGRACASHRSCCILAQSWAA